ncbi:conserved membrane protein of unknown function [Candidatus Hydrogenisulfobacillus filiaventi]|uniref:YhgE/Pip domain-containing protein n=1 Tax=Candidatus Hydrogenisulfobacillus filiaventi TaxID=2707344 RepID=A0A6F8ZI95_9FIRM|nr:conserved membrane protein of unknown function [Candidatus Hydrogenisulfobacillus filiaventi]
MGSPLLTTRKGWLALLAVGLVPLLYTVTYLGAFWNPYRLVPHLPVALVLQDQSGAARAVAAALPRRWPVRRETAAGARRALRAGRVSWVLTVPAGFGAALAQGRPAPLQVAVDPGSNYLGAVLAQREAEAFARGVAARLRRELLQRAAAGLQQARAGAGALGDQLNRAAGASRALTRDAAGLATGAAGLAAADGQLAGGANRLSAALQAAAASDPALEGLAGQAAALAQGAGTAARRADALAAGGRQLAAGNAALSAGLQTAAGAAGRLAAGSGRVTWFLPRAASPLRLQVTAVDGGSSSYGQGLAPYFLGLSLWVGALVATVLVGGGPARGRGRRLAASALIAGLQVTLLAAGALLLLPLHPRYPAALLLALAGIGAVDWAVMRLLVERLGDGGRLLGIVLLVLQLAGSGGTYPPALTAGFFRRLHPWLPMSWAVRVLRFTLSGALGSRVEAAALALAALGGGALLLTVWGRWRLAFEAPPLEAEAAELPGTAG